MQVIWWSPVTPVMKVYVEMVGALRSLTYRAFWQFIASFANTNCSERRPYNPTYTERETEDALQATGAATIVVLNRFYGKLKSIQSRTALKRVIVTGIKDYLPWNLRLAYTVFKERKDGERIDIAEGDFRFSRLLRR